MKKFLEILIFCLLLIGSANSNNDLYSYLNNHELNNKKDLNPGEFHFRVIEEKKFKKLLADEVNDLPIYLGMTKEKQPFNTMFHELIRNHAAFFKEIKINNENYFINSGCRFKSCGEKGFLWVDKQNKIILGANIHYFFNDKKKFNRQGDLLIFSKKFSSYNDLPDQFKGDLQKWVSRVAFYDPFEEDKDKQTKPFLPKNIRFLNSQNKILILENIK